MKKSVFTYGLLVFLMIINGVACKKSSNSNPFADAKIAAATVNNGGAIVNYQFFYDAYNNLDSLSGIGTGSASGQITFLKFNYIGSSWSVTDQNGYSFTVYANTAGQLLKVLVADTLSFLYTNNQLTEINQYSASATPPYYTNTPTYYTWANGDVATAVTGSRTETYTYNTSKNGQPGDPIRIAAFLEFGASAIKTTHLPAGVSSSSSQGVSYSYTFDSKGRISVLTEDVYDKTANTNDTTTYAYTYY